MITQISLFVSTLILRPEEQPTCSLATTRISFHKRWANVSSLKIAPETMAFNDRIFATPMVGGPIQAKEFLESEYQKWSKLVKENNLQID
jgi:hypothetical protein